MIKKSIKKHFKYYISFIFVQALGFIAILFAVGNRPLQLALILTTTLFYFVFAIVHQAMDHELNAKVVVEYALMGCFGLTLSLIVFNS